MTSFFFNNSNTSLNRIVGTVLHGLEGMCMPLEDATGVVAVNIASDPVGNPVKKNPTAKGTFIYAMTGEDAEGFVANEPAPNRASRSVIMFVNGMEFVGKTGIDSGIVAGDKITATDGVFAKAVIGDKVIGECYEDGVNNEDATYGTIPIKVVDRYSLGSVGGGSSEVTKEYVDEADTLLQTNITAEETARIAGDAGATGDTANRAKNIK